MRRITYKNACRQSNSAHMTKERIYREMLVTLEKKRDVLEEDIVGILDRFLHSDSPLSEEFKEKKHNFATICTEIAEMERKVTEHLAAQQEIER